MIETLKKIEFHDKSLADLKLDFSNKLIEISWIDNPDIDFTPTTIQFQEIKSIQFENLDLLVNPDIEIYSADISVDKDTIKIKFLFLLGLGRQSWKLEFTFKAYAFI